MYFVCGKIKCTLWTLHCGYAGPSGHQRATNEFRGSLLGDGDYKNRDQYPLAQSKFCFHDNWLVHRNPTCPQTPDVRTGWRGPSLQPDKSNSRSTEQSPNDVEGTSYTAAVNYSEVEVTEIVSNKDKDEQHIAFKIVANPHNQREMISTAGVMKAHVCLEESVEQQGVDVIKGSNEPTREWNGMK